MGQTQHAYGLEVNFLHREAGWKEVGVGFSRVKVSM
jgi:hypothetical protein